MTPKELKILMIQKDVSQSQIAASAAVTRQTVSLVCNGHSRSRRVEQIVANHVQLPRQFIFPIHPEPIQARGRDAA